MLFELDRVPEKHRESFEDINKAIEALRDRRKECVTAVTDPLTPKPVWKVEVYVQGLTYRCVALAEGACQAWNGGNLLVAVILARCMVETAAMCWSFWSKLEIAMANEDLQEIDGHVMSHTFSSRWGDWQGDVSPTPNILTLIEKLDRHFLKAPDRSYVRQSYDFLSEFAHPNWPGTVGLFGDLNPEKHETTFRANRPKEKLLATHVIAGVGTIRIVGHCLDNVIDALPEVWRLCEDRS